jgi:hypothetical protein
MRTSRMHRIQKPAGLRSLGDERGALMIIAIVFVVVFTILGVAIYYLVASQVRSTETERTDVKSFNVAEAGVDAGMLALKLDWPRSEPGTSVDQSIIVTALRSTNSGLYLPKVGGVEDASKLLQVTIYDNVDPATGQTTSVANPAAPKWDSNDNGPGKAKGDGKMFIDSTAYVGNDRHRIIVLAEKQKWNFNFPAPLALWAGVVDSNGQGLEISVEYTDDPSKPVLYDVHDSQHKGLDISAGVQQTPQSGNFASVCSDKQLVELEKAARDRQTYFEGTAGAAAASAFLDSGAARGAIVYVKADTGITLSGDKQIGTEDEPVVVIIDSRNAPAGTVNTWDMKGTADLYGILVTVGDSTLRGTCSVHGAMYVSGKLDNMGNGNCGEIQYNQKCIANINRQFVISVNLVPNTWEEYTLPNQPSTSTT